MTLFLTCTSNKEMKGGPKPVRVKWFASAKGVTCHHPCYPAQSCLSSCITDSAQHSGITEKQLVRTLIFHFPLLMALLTASALVTVTHVSVLLSLHRCMWLSQMFLGLTALAVCSKAEPFKQLLCQLDFEPGEKDLQSTALQPRGVGAELGHSLLSLLE